MQNNFVGDIGDYGKYGLLRQICAAGLSLSVNWYKVVPSSVSRHDDGKYIDYLNNPEKFRSYDPSLFDSLRNIVWVEGERTLDRIEEERLFPANYYSMPLDGYRDYWHTEALRQTEGTDVVFLDPDNGLETSIMYESNSARSVHVKWDELTDYYDRGQSVILYQHLPRKTKEQCVADMLSFQNNYLHADDVKILEYSRISTRFYFIFMHYGHGEAINKALDSIERKWSRDKFCKIIAR